MEQKHVSNHQPDVITIAHQQKASTSLLTITTVYNVIQSQP